MARPKRHPSPYIWCTECINGTAVEGIDSNATLSSLTYIGPCKVCNGLGVLGAHAIGKLPVGSVFIDIEGNTCTLTRKAERAHGVTEGGDAVQYGLGVAVKLVRLCHMSFTVPGAR